MDFEWRAQPDFLVGTLPYAQDPAIISRASKRSNRHYPEPPRHREHAHRGSHILLSVRRPKQDERRITAPYTFLGPAVYVTHQGERPMSITWNLHHPMPAELFEDTKVAAG